MRTTVDLPDAVHGRVRRLADERGMSLSSVVAELTIRGLASLEAPVEVSVDPESGVPSISLGRTITAEDVTAALDDE